MTEVGEHILLSSGVEIKVLPFPQRLWTKVNEKAMIDFPDPPIPTKTVPVVDGTEEVEDLDDPEYLILQRQASAERFNRIGEAIFKVCVLADYTPFADDMESIAELAGEEWPEKEADRKLFFLENYAVRSKSDYEIIMISSSEQMVVSDDEVAHRLDSFQRQMAQYTDNEVETSGSNENERVDVPSEA